MVIAFVEALRNPFKIRWRETFYYLEQCGVKSLPIVLIICFLLGVILAFQGALQLAQFGTQIFIVDLVGWSVLMELGPFMVAIIATGRAGSAFAAEIGTMIADEEVNALKTMGISVARFLVIPKLLALAIAMPILTCFGNIAALLGGLFIGVTVGDVPLAAYVSRTLTVLTPNAFMFGVGKSIVFAVIIALVGCFRGLQSTMDAQGVGRSATNAVVSSIFAVVISDAIITLLDSLS
ncbi:MAG: ABC transporter permease [Lentisphaeria bacterium]|nr:ABC transporter permease [Lentisphaeria bacterium]